MPELPLTDARWTALAARAPRFDLDSTSEDGAAVYAVRTTGVYCRPGCGARTPTRANVVLFATSADARAAGFRACRRCRPDADPATDDAIDRARAHIDACLDADPEARVGLDALAAHVGVSRGHVQRRFTARVGLSPRAYADAGRAARAADALRGGATVLGATFDGGFGSAHALYDRADEVFGMTPGAFRSGGRGLRVRYALFETALGAALVAATARGVCAVTLGGDGAALEDALRADLHAAEITRDDAAVGPWAEPVLRALAGAPGDASAALLTLPLDVRGTVFQRRVWALLREIPAGETRTYGEVAARLGQPTASRAVAQACGANPVALVVPCHRVVGADGALRGYRWGPDRKRRLLADEGAMAG